MLPPSRNSAAKALTLIRREMASKRLNREALGVFNTPGLGGVVLPGYNVFSSDGTHRAAHWCVPYLRVDFDDLVAVYEEYADRPFGQVRRPDRLVASVLRGNQALVPACAPEQWWLPAAQLIAVMSNASGTPVNANGNHLVLEVDQYRFELSESGMWSNFRGRFRTAAEKSSAAHMVPLSTGRLDTHHPLAHLVLKPGVSLGAQWAANYILRTEQAGKIEPVTVDEVLGTPRRHKVKVDRTLLTQRADLAGAVAGVRELMGFGGTIQELYVATVPYLMTAREFRTAFCCPWTFAERLITDKSRERMEEILITAEKVI